MDDQLRSGDPLSTALRMGNVLCEVDSVCIKVGNKYLKNYLHIANTNGALTDEPSWLMMPLSGVSPKIIARLVELFPNEKIFIYECKAILAYTHIHDPVSFLEAHAASVRQMQIDALQREILLKQQLLEALTNENH